MTGLYIFVALAVIALVGWGVAELKYKSRKRKLKTISMK